MTSRGSFRSAGSPAPAPYDRSVPDWDAELVLAEARWARLSPASDGFNSTDPAGLVGDEVDPIPPRISILDWFSAAAAELVTQEEIRPIELRSWEARFSADVSQRARSTSTSRRHLPIVASGIARLLASGTSQWAAPPSMP